MKKLKSKINKVFRSVVTYKPTLLDIILLVAFLISAYIRFWQIGNFNFAFTFDQARDMLEIRPMAHFQDFKLTGPTTSINGLLLGPYYYYYLLPAYWLGEGSPQALTAWNVVSFLATGLILYFAVKKFDRFGAFFVTLFFLLSPQLFVITSYFWNANAAVYFGALFFLSIYLYSKKQTTFNLFLITVFAALAVQFEAAFGIVCLSYAFILAVISRDKTKVKVFIFTAIPLFVPQLLFEVAHNFQMTRYFMSIFNSQSVLGVKTPFADVFRGHYLAITDMFEGQMMLKYGYGYYYLIASLLVLFGSKTTRKLAVYLFGFLIASFIFYMIIYHHPLKVWYLQGYRVWYLFVFGSAISVVVTKIKSFNSSTLKAIFFGLIAFLLIKNFYLVLQDKYNVIAKSQASNDPKNARNIVNTIDWVYDQARRESFEAYSYVPEVLDYPYQYFYWWYGTKEFGYTPTVASYSLIDVPIYLNKPERFISTIGGGKTDKIGLIYERKSKYKDWLNQFSDYCVIVKKDFPWEVSAEWREKCK